MQEIQEVGHEFHVIVCKQVKRKGIYMCTQVWWYRRPESYGMAIYESCTESALHTFQIATSSVTLETVNNT